MVNTPLPQNLEDECKKAAKILKSFTMDKVSSGGVDRVIPPTMIAKAKGLAILTVVKAGFLVTARAGSGLVVAKLADGTWSAPSAIATAGIGGGFELGAEITDFVFILNSPNAVDAFSKGGNLTLGGNLSVAVGPIGRNAEADVAIRSPAAIYTYSRTQGLFAGISLEGSGIFERKEANRKMYQKDVRSTQLLSGLVQPPDEAEPLYAALRDHMRGMVVDAAGEGISRGKAYAASKGFGGGDDDFGGFGGGGSSGGSSESSSRFSLPSMKRSGGGGGGGGDDGGGSSSGGRSSGSSAMTYSQQREAASKSNRSGGSSGSGRGSSSHEPSKSYSGGQRSQRRSSSSRSAKNKDSAADSFDVNAGWNADTIVQARWDYFSDTAGDLNFRRGDKIVVTLQTGKTDDWWEGKLRGIVGIFPANYVVDVSA
ncbi:SH3 domain-containing YSC84-like protein 1 [Sycon ciliatum]|uniref:SH3 domain-containing YSC84-like protein 1 n=1 Tax=Sycon ciliatum TaxID=27933 RepID=UPI0031F69777